MNDLRKAAEELIKEWDWECGEHQNKALAELIEALRQALAQPEQEPVAWQDPQYKTLIEPHKAHPDWIPLYTAPPKREWVGLTDEELKVLCDEWQIIYGGYVRPFAETIEAKLKEKNT